MKFILVFSILFALDVEAKKDVNNFHKTLVEDVQKDIQNQNVEDFKPQSRRTRGPASVQNEKTFPEESELEKKERQLGSKKW